ncbi:MAG: hypothetical protein EA343_16720 [Nodularia sp. (in: Bacteria)]|nr:MAG: hypothetical protein EA343_16720 [Nodularia sp. (in: cyanobacteria)]
MASQIDINLSEEVLQRWQTAKSVVNQSVNSITNSAQQFSQSLKETANTTTDQALDTVTNTLEQAKGSIEQTWQTAEHIKNTTSVALQTAITSSVNDWLNQHPAFLRLFHTLEWGVNHPILSLIILVLGITVLLSIIKAIIRLIATASWSILQIPLKLIWAFIKLSFVSLTKFRGLAVQPVIDPQTTHKLVVISTKPPSLKQDKNQRLAEISSRLEKIQQEQQELLQEAADLIATEKIET